MSLDLEELFASMVGKVIYDARARGSEWFTLPPNGLTTADVEHRIRERIAERGYPPDRVSVTVAVEDRMPWRVDVRFYSAETRRLLYTEETIVNVLEGHEDHRGRDVERPPPLADR